MVLSILRTHSRVLLFAVFAAVIAGGAVYATVPDAYGNVHVCYGSNGVAHIYDPTVGDTCKDSTVDLLSSNVVVTHRRDLGPYGLWETEMTLPGLGTIDLYCAGFGAPSASIRFTNTSGYVTRSFVNQAGAAPTQTVLANGGSQELSLGSSPAQVTWQIAGYFYLYPTPVTTIVISENADNTFYPGQCQFVGQAVITH